MRLVAATVVVCLAWAACSRADLAQPVRFEPGTNFSLKVGQSARARDGSLQVGFEGVTADSRCPQGEQCVRAGDAAALVWLQQGSGSKETRELHVAPGATQVLRVVDHDMRLVRLDPYPITGRPVSKDDYVVTLVLSHGSTAEPDR